MAFLGLHGPWTAACAAVIFLAASATLSDPWIRIGQMRRERLTRPDDPGLNRRAPERFEVWLETSKGQIAVDVTRRWSPHGADRFFNLAEAGYYDDSRFFRVVADRWAQFGVHGKPEVAKAWRDRTIPDDPRVESNVKGTVAFAFAVPNGRTTQVFINLRDNSEGHDKEPFVPFGRITRGLERIDQLNGEYGDTCGGGIRAGKQAPLFELGNTYLDQTCPRLDRIYRTSVHPR